MTKAKHPHHFFNAATSNGTLTLDMYDYIGGDFSGISEGMVSAALKSSDSKSVTINLNSPGGDAFAGVAIRNVLLQSNKKVVVNVVGLAASAASIVAMAGSTITMHSGSVMMIHPAQALAMGSASDMRKMADTLDTVTGSIADIYVAKTGLSKDTIMSMVQAETWMSAEDAVAKGFATSVTKEKAAVVNKADLKGFQNAPADLLNKAAKQDDESDDCECACAECSADDCENCSCTSPDCVCPFDPDEDDGVDNAAKANIEAAAQPAFDNVSLLMRRLEINRRR